MMLVNVWKRCQAGLTGLIMIACLLITGNGHAQIVDPKALGGTTRCVTIADSLYEITVDVQSPALCPFTSYTITWDLLDRSSVGQRVTGPGPIKHTYRLTDFLKNCGNGSDNGERLIKVETDCNRDNKSFSIYFKIKPTAEPFIPDICIDRAISLQNKSCASTADTKFLWTFPDGTTSASANPFKTFSTATVGTTIPISLSASNDCGSSVKTINVPVRGTPTAKVKASDYSFLAQDTTITCLPSGGTLTMDATTSLDGTSYQWSITPSTYRYVQNTNSSSPIAKIQFTRTGNYTITLIAINDCGRSQPAICQHRAVDVPTVTLGKQADLCEASKYTLTGITPGASYSLNGALILPGQQIDVPVSNTPYIVIGSAVNQCGVRTVADTFLVQSPQAVQISLPSQQTVVCAGTARFPISVNLTGGDWDGTGKDFIETTSNGAFFNPRTIGQYTVIYKRGSGVCSRSDAVQISVEGGRPIVQNVSACGSESFIKLRGDPTGGVGTWSLPGNPGAVRNDTLFLAGLTAAQLTVTYQVRYGVSGCLSTTTATVNIGRPKAAFTITGACSNSAPQVQNQSTGGSTFDWTLNGLSGITGNQPTFTLVPGLNRIELKVSAGSCSDVASQTLLVVAPPTPVSISTAFLSDCSPMRVTFTQPGTANSTVQYAWNLAQGQTSTAFTPPVQTYLNQSRLPQPISVSLTASNGCG